MMGGAEIMVKGQNYVNDAPSNVPQYIVESFSNLVVQGTDLNGKPNCPAISPNQILHAF